MKIRWIKEKAKWEVDSQRKLIPRRRSRVNTKDEAEALLKEWQKEAQVGGKVGFLDISVRSQAQQAMDLLKEAKATENLLEAVSWFVKRKYPGGGAKTVHKLVEEFIEMKNKTLRANGEQRYSEFYLRSLHRFIQFSNVYGDYPVYSIRPRHIKEWLDSLKLNDFSKKQYYQYLGMLWKYAKLHDLIADNPMDLVAPPDVVPKDPQIFTITQCKDLLETAFDEFNQDYYPFTILALFCGIRPHEVLRLKWGDIKHGSIVRLMAAQTKTMSNRSVPIPLYAQRMLQGYLDFHQHLGTKDPIVPVGYHRFRYDYRRLKKRAGIKVVEWVKDGLRHTFASYYYSACNDMSKLTERMGHATPKMTLKHYVNLASENWLDFFTLCPDVNAKSELDKLLETTCKREEGPVKIWDRAALLKTLNL
jgi:integrase